MPLGLPRLLKRNKKDKKTIDINNNKMGCTQSKATSGAVASDGLSKGKFVFISFFIAKWAHCFAIQLNQSYTTYYKKQPGHPHQQVQQQTRPSLPTRITIHHHLQKYHPALYKAHLPNQTYQ